MESTTETTVVEKKSPGFFSMQNPLFKLLLIVAVIGVGVFLLIRLVARAPGAAARGVFGGRSRGKENKIIRAEARRTTAVSRAATREDRQDRRDLRALIRAAKQERRACRKAARGVRRRGGARRRARAACQQAYQNTLAALRAEMSTSEAAEAATDDDAGDE